MTNTPSTIRRRVRRGAAVASLAATAMLVSACGAGATGGDDDVYPSRPINIVIPYAQGGGTDAFLLPILEQVEESIGADLQLIYMPGAGATEGNGFVAAEDPDGYTLILGDIGSTIVSPLIQDLSYTPDSFDPIWRLSTFPLAYFVPADSPWKDFGDFVEAAEEAPGEIAYGASGPATTDRIAMLLFQQESGIELRPVTYDTSSAVLQAAISSEVQIGGASLGPLAQHLDAGTLRLLATTSPAADSQGFPTIEDAGYPGYSFVGFRSLLAPAGVSEDVIAFWEEAAEKVAANQQIADTVLESAAGEVFAPLGPGEFKEFFDDYVGSVEPITSQF